MAAKDYGFFPAEVTGEIYLAKKIKNPHVMSSDRRLVTGNEITAMFEHYLRHFCKQHLGKTMTVMDGDKVIFQATLNDYEPKINPERPKINGHDLCSACNKEFKSLELQSPMLSDKLWQEVMDFYSLNQPDRDKGEHVFICTDCMEKALGRKLTPDDLAPVLWNQVYLIHHFYGVDLDTAMQLRSVAKRYATQDAPKIPKDDYRRYTDFIAGVVAVFKNPKLAGLISAIKNIKDDQ